MSEGGFSVTCGCPTCGRRPGGLSLPADHPTPTSARAARSRRRQAGGACATACSPPSGSASGCPAAGPAAGRDPRPGPRLPARAGGRGRDGFHRRQRPGLPAPLGHRGRHGMIAGLLAGRGPSPRPGRGLPCPACWNR